MENKFNFYEVIKINSKEKEHDKINGKTGVVMGMAQNHIGKWYYAVTIDEDGWSIGEEYLVSTVNFSSRDQFYSGDTIKVVVNEKGEGSIKEDD